MNKQNNPPGVLMLDLEGTSISSFEYDLLQRRSVGGLILFSRNYESPLQLKELIAAVRECRKELLIAVDQEGGRVQRFREGFLKLPALQLIGEAVAENKKRGLEVAKQCGWAMAAEVLHYGLDLSFAPVLDLLTTKSQVIGDRAFANNADALVLTASSYIDGMNAAGMKATGKHFPGHGTVEADSHIELPCDDRTSEELLNNDYRVFAELAPKLGALMPAHVRYPAVDENCAGYSTLWIQEKIRDELKFEGVVFSDDLSMTAAHGAGDAADRAALALNAGCDMILVCNDRAAALNVADWIEFSGIEGHSRISGMRSEPAAEISDLYNEPKWHAAKDMVASLTSN
ncbi:MAG: beta-N-acetylhexosaminidase [Pseudohongiellaceae bacterium]|tara:strand:- start:495 stop:1526 length:1032 start_codon:yes stop_codon:yes gene_type:complete